MTPQSYLADYGPDLLNLGYPIIPIKRGYKFPKGLKNWEQVEADDELLKAWLANGFADGGVGIICGDVTAVDLDIRDEAITNQLIGYIEHNIGITVQRIGQAPKSLLVFATDNPFSKITSATYTDPDNREHKVEILGQGQQFVAYAEHPDTNEPYYWVDDHGLADTPKFDLPVISQEQAHDIVEYFETIVPADWTVKRRKSKSNQQIDLSVPEDVRVLHHSKPPLEGFDDKKVRRALAYITDQSDDYHDWVKVGMALHHQYSGGNDGFAIWDEWSIYSDKYDPAQMRSKWNSFEANLANTNPITFATILKEAKAAYKKVNRPTQTHFKLIQAADVLSKLGPVDWLVKGYIERELVGLMFGDPGSFKSFLALDIAFHVAAGKCWHGAEVQQGPVIYIAGEGHGGLARRFAAWQTFHGTDLTELPFFVSEQAAQLYDKESAEQVADAVTEIAKHSTKPALIVIDTLARNFGPGDENSNNDMNVFIARVDQLLRDKFGATVLIVHHTGYSHKERARGATALKGGIDFEYRVDKKPDSLSVRLENTKMKNTKELSDTWFEGHEVVVGVFEDDEIASLVFEKSNRPVVEERPILKGKQAALFNVIEREAPVGRQALRNIVLAEDIFENADQFKRALQEVKKKEYVQEHDGVVSTIDPYFAGHVPDIAENVPDKKEMSGTNQIMS